MAGQGGKRGPGPDGAEPRRGGAESGPGGAAGTPRRDPATYTAAEKLAILEAYEASGRGMRAFCAEQGLSTATLCSWRRRLASERLPGLEPRPNPRNRGKRGKRTYTPEERRKAVEAFSKGRMTAVDFARVWEISTKALLQWSRRYERDGAKGLEPRERKRRGSGGFAAKRLPAPLRAEITRVLKRFPFFGLRRVRDWLRRFQGIAVSPGTVRRVRQEERLPPPEPPRRRHRRRPAVRRDELDPARREPFAERLAVVPLVADHPSRILARPPTAGSRDRDDRQCGFRQRHFRRGRREEGASQWKTLAVDHHHPLRSLAAFSLPDREPPFFAGAQLASMNTSSQSTRPFASSSARKPLHTLSQVPSRSHRWSRRQHVSGLGNPDGRSRHGAPVRSIQRIPSRTSRLSLQGHARLRSSGSNGSFFPHCRSLSICGRLTRFTSRKSRIGSRWTDHCLMKPLLVTQRAHHAAQVLSSSVVWRPRARRCGAGCRSAAPCR